MQAKTAISVDGLKPPGRIGGSPTAMPQERGRGRERRHIHAPAPRSAGRTSRSVDERLAFAFPCFDAITAELASDSLAIDKVASVLQSLAPSTLGLTDG